MSLGLPRAMPWAAPVAMALCLALACDDVVEPRALERMEKLASTHHPVAPAALARLDDEERVALRTLALDDERPLWLRLRALGLVSAHPTRETRALWRELRAAPERELRWQAAWAEGLSHVGEERLRFAAALLAHEAEALREAGAHLLATLDDVDGRTRAVAMARAQVGREPSAAVRAVLERKLLRGP